jgi:hypothetical protein
MRTTRSIALFSSALVGVLGLSTGAAAAANTCKLPDPYGCRLENLWVSDSWVQEDWGQGPMRQACEGHDLCYREAGAVKESCDSRFRAELFATCDKLEEWWHAPDCLLAASLYAHAAEVAGGSAYDRAQRCLIGGETPPAPRPLHVKIEPERFYPADQPATFKVVVTNDALEEIVGAGVLIDGHVWDAGKTFTFTPRLITEREGNRTIIKAPGIVASAPGYASTTKSLSMVMPRLKVKAEPREVSCGSTDVVFEATDRLGKSVAGTVTIGNRVGPTGSPIKIEAPMDDAGECEVPDVWISAEGFPDTPAMKHRTVKTR